jgi:hypothetical protein
MKERIIPNKNHKDLTLLLDDDVAEKVKDIEIHFSYHHINQPSFFFTENGKRTCLPRLIVGNEKINKFLDGNRCNLQRSNLSVITQTYKPPIKKRIFCDLTKVSTFPVDFELIKSACKIYWHKFHLNTQGLEVGDLISETYIRLAKTPKFYEANSKPMVKYLVAAKLTAYQFWNNYNSSIISKCSICDISSIDNLLHDNTSSKIDDDIDNSKIINEIYRSVDSRDQQILENISLEKSPNEDPNTVRANTYTAKNHHRQVLRRKIAEQFEHLVPA